MAGGVFVHGIVLLITLYAVQGKDLPYPEGIQGKTFQNCGETELVTSATRSKTLKSPGWDFGGYESNTDCAYILKINSYSNTHMRMKFTGLDIQTDPGCNRDYVLIFDNISGKFMGKFCGSAARLSYLTIPSKEARVVFHTDDEIQARGFKLKFWRVGTNYAPGVNCLEYGAADGCITCGGQLTASSGTIQSVFYDDPTTDYPHLISCEWSIIPNTVQPKYMKLWTTGLDLEVSEQCIYDSVSVYGVGDQDPLATFCGNTCSPTLIIDASQAIVNFTSDFSVSSGGFQMNYQLIDTASGEAPGLTCGCGANEGCFGDITNIPSSSTTTTTTTTPSTTTATGSQQCSGSYVSSSGSIQSPNYPGHYGNLENCVNDITVPSGMHIQFTVNHFELEHHNSCDWDRFEIYEGASSSPSHVFCGSHSGTLTIPNNQVTLVFTSDSTVTATGYDISFTAVVADTDDGENESGTCGGVLTSPSGTIQSPNYPDNYPDNLNCVWTITAEAGKVIEIIAGSFHIESNSGCTYDSLTYYEGTVNSYSFLQKYCGTNFPPTLVSQGNTVTLVFSTDVSVQYGGFSLNYASIDPADVDDDDDGNNGGSNVICGVVPDSRIVGGTNADAHEYPWMIQLRHNGYFICGGTLVSPKWVITAAHCVWGSSASSFSVVAGIHSLSGSESSQQTRSVSRIINHYGYSDATLTNDIALLELSSAVTWTNHVRPACVSSEDPIVGQSCVITGWGDTETAVSLPSVLQEAVVPILSNDACDNSYATAGYNILDDMMCAGYFEGGIDTCQGDSGGPLVCQSSGAYTLQGVTSWGAGCADPNFPGVYTRVARYTSWITLNSGGEIPIAA